MPGATIPRAVGTQPHATVSMDLLAHAGVPPSTAIVDVGGGASTLVDGCSTRTSRCHRVGCGQLRWALPAHVGPDRQCQVNWVVADIESWQPSRSYGVWHDRAVLHFMVDRHQQAAYRRALMTVRRPSTPSHHRLRFQYLDGPLQCSGRRSVAMTEQAATVPNDRAVRRVRRWKREVSRTTGRC